MAQLIFLPTENGMFKAQCPNACTLQVKLKKQGIITIEASLEGMPPATLYNYAGENMLRSINLPSSCVATVTTNVEVEEAQYTIEE